MTAQAEKKADAMEKAGEKADENGTPGPAATATK